MLQLARIAAFLLGIESATGVGELSPLAAAAACMASVSLIAIAAQVSLETRSVGESGGQTNRVAERQRGREAERHRQRSSAETVRNLKGETEQRRRGGGGTP
jgi:hypothetical protein